MKGILVRDDAAFERFGEQMGNVGLVMSVQLYSASNHRLILCPTGRYMKAKGWNSTTSDMCTLTEAAYDSQHLAIGPLVQFLH